jgi:hypothetical protein
VRVVSPERFVGDFLAHVRAEAANLRGYGASDQAQAVERVAQHLEDRFRSWWLAELTVTDAARESGYSEERLRQMARNGDLPHTKGEGAKGHVLIARCDLPRRPTPPAARITSIEDRLLRRPART